MHSRETLQKAISRLMAGADMEMPVELQPEESREILKWLQGEKYRGGTDIGLRGWASGR